jgi:hypothetical protein
LAPRRLPRLMLPALAAASTLAACGGAFSTQELGRAPAWFKERQKELAGQGYPDLTGVPEPGLTPAEAARWAKTEEELRAASAEINASPRGQPAPVGDTDAESFDKSARDAIDSARPGGAKESAPAAEPARPQ